MKILEFISSEGYYGAERVMVTLGKYLQKTGIEVLAGIFSNLHRPSNDVAKRAAEAGLTVFQTPCAGKVDWAAVRSLRTRILQERSDIVHTHGYKADIYAKLACRGLHVPLVATYHHGTTRHPTEGWALKLYDKLDCRTLRTFDRVVAVSDPIKEFLRATGVAERKLAVIRNGIDLDSFQEDGEATLRHDLALGNRRIVGMVGRLHPEKGARHLLIAAEGVLKQRPDVMFVFVGDGPERQELTSLSHSLGIGSNVLFTGVRTDVAGVYRSLDVVVLPSLNEGLPMTVIEALAAKRPVVATAVGGVPRIIRDGETGILVESANPAALGQAVLDLLEGPERAARLAARGQDLVKAEYSAETMAREYIDVFRGVSGTRRPEAIHESRGQTL